MSYARGLPLMAVVEAGLRSEGLLERGYDWYVQSVKPEAASLNSPEFNGVLASWKQKLLSTSQKRILPKASAELTVAELLGSLRPAQLWSVLAAVAGLLAGSFALGAKLFAGK